MLSAFIPVFVSLLFFVLFLVSSSAIFYLSSFSLTYIIDWDINPSSVISLNTPLELSTLTTSFTSTVSLIVFSVMLFSFSYMGNEIFKMRFYCLILLFVFSMVMLIICPSLMLMLLGWDGLGVTSFLLVIYYNNAKSNNAGMITLLTNRVGDVLIITSIFFVFSTSSWDFFSHFNGFWGKTSTLMFVLAMFTKSAQVPFSSWLPSAMAAPTPVSALVHSSTLVTAGIYILVRLKMCETCLPSSLLLFVGTTTCVFASMSAFKESDLKKIVALSTLSQLGFMVSSLGMMSWEVAFFHLISHAYFKALFFITMGNLIHISSSYQDSRKISCQTISSINLSFMLLSNMSLCGLPFMAGFYSKDWVLEFSQSVFSNLACTLFLFGSVVMTSIYTFSLISSTWVWGVKTSGALSEQDEKTVYMLSSCLLALMSISAGPMVLGLLNKFNKVPLFFSTTKFALVGMILLGVLLGFKFTTLMSFIPHINKAFTTSWGDMWQSYTLSSSFFSNFLKLAYRKVVSVDLKWFSQSPGWLSSTLHASLSASLSKTTNTSHSHMILYVLLFWTMLAI